MGAWIPFGQWAMRGEEMPPSWTQCLYSRKGVLETLAQFSPYPISVSGGPGITPLPRRRG